MPKHSMISRMRGECLKRSRSGEIGKNFARAGMDNGGGSPVIAHQKHKETKRTLNIQKNGSFAICAMMYS